MSDPRPHRETLFLEEAEIIGHEAWPGAQHVLRLQAPRCARDALPGSFVHLRCDPLLPMRRPLSIQRAEPRKGWIELLYRVVGAGTEVLARRAVGESLSVLGPIGRPFAPSAARDLPLLVGGGVGIPPMVFLADWLRQHRPESPPVVLMGSESPFPFQPEPSRIPVGGLGPEVNAAMPLLEGWGIPSRLASGVPRPGCHQGLVTELARQWLEDLDPRALARVEIFACGPHPMLAAVAALAREFGVPCQVSLEEFMACAVGGCAGCVVPVRTAEGLAMRRVCVDGPVFDAREVFEACSV